MAEPEVTACIPSIPPRAAGLRQRALASVLAQDCPAAAVALAVDTDHAGPWVTRQRALEMVRTTWVAFLDDDDEWLPPHLGRLLWAQQRTGADLVFSYFVPVGMGDPLGHFGRPFDPANPHATTMTVLCRTSLARHVGFTAPPPGHTTENSGEDARFIQGVVDAGARIVHLPERTWRWHWHPYDPGGPNTHGLPTMW
jgi:glycosyltransferase involved in cell wall biosynthesis